MKSSLEVTTVLEPTDYSAKLAAARAFLRERGRTEAIDPSPPRPVLQPGDSRVLMRGRCPHGEWLLLCRVCSP